MLQKLLQAKKPIQKLPPTVHICNCEYIHNTTQCHTYTEKWEYDHDRNTYSIVTDSHSEMLFGPTTFPKNWRRYFCAFPLHFLFGMFWIIFCSIVWDIRKPEVLEKTFLRLQKNALFIVCFRFWLYFYFLCFFLFSKWLSVTIHKYVRNYRTWYQTAKLCLCRYTSARKFSSATMYISLSTLKYCT